MRDSPPGRVIASLVRRVGYVRSGPPRSFHPFPFDGAVDPGRTGRFVVVSDLQRTSSIELWRESNVDERARIVREIAALGPDFVAILGDLVFYGASEVDWAELDALGLPLREARVPVLPVLGNHECWWSPRAALKHYFARFPHLHGRRWYSLAHGALGLLFLDSNQRWMSAAQWKEQLAWYAGELARFDRDPAVRGVLVMLHHPPYTNSTVTSDELHVQRDIVPAFFSARKTLAMLSGHVHSYERFTRAGKMFVVTGGGGGPRMRLATGQRRRHQDDLFDGPPLRGFHFLTFSLSRTGVEVAMRGIEKGGRDFSTMDAFTLRWAEESLPGQ